MSGPVAMSQEKYIPVHRRKPSSSSSSSSSPSSSNSSISSSGSVYPTSNINDRIPPLVQYTPAELLALAASPLSRLVPETLVDAPPEMVGGKSAGKWGGRRRAVVGRRRKLAWAVPVVKEGDGVSWRRSR
ncbi:hypothetical protein NEOLEDRAFT_1134551 [Neolentinus lepideus HHB14362 ss-1]|uniref:Uncharacterized protein n=1 Tax=Neolentinus lepideus HHB14362 ss-1 TaxID=1314782 RepID=A0A165S9W5_9AGAM|nr:hypothetical protein NEOLEDRAFT_1134551 [Neolentinus lepideus HHB14362 ss-1]